MRQFLNYRNINFALLAVLVCNILLYSRYFNREADLVSQCDTVCLIYESHSEAAGKRSDQEPSTTPASGEEDDDEMGDDDDMEAQSFSPLQKIASCFSYYRVQDPLYGDPHLEMIFPPPKS